MSKISCYCLVKLVPILYWTKQWMITMCINLPFFLYCISTQIAKSWEKVIGIMIIIVLMFRVLTDFSPKNRGSKRCREQNGSISVLVCYWCWALIRLVPVVNCHPKTTNLISAEKTGAAPIKIWKCSYVPCKSITIVGIFRRYYLLLFAAFIVLQMIWSSNLFIYICNH